MTAAMSGAGQAQVRDDGEVTGAPRWSMRSWLAAIDRPEIVDDALRRDDPYAGVALLTLVLNHPEPDVVLPRIKRALASVSAQTRANALQSLGHYARLHGRIDADSLAHLRRALRDRTVLHGYEIRGYAGDAASDVAIFVPRRRLPRWLRRRFAGPAPRS
ncbi:hypothetical protein [Micromonospora aurantiaca (nom. illeg.)]|uniref:hypothetical protein n=1 Tax=Micromonospora aurantiaca (nom. illeg.) TaxID=47850 RepID=UPI00165763EA|nr:hypothetical protein [Micromonospora aurantiaca]MBC9003267.1 hypothetical protein [Micromonospora aurantiaca]